MRRKLMLSLAATIAIAILAAYGVAHCFDCSDNDPCFNDSGCLGPCDCDLKPDSPSFEECVNG